MCPLSFKFHLLFPVLGSLYRRRLARGRVNCMSCLARSLECNVGFSYYQLGRSGQQVKAPTMYMSSTAQCNIRKRGRLFSTRSVRQPVASHLHYHYALGSHRRLSYSTSIAFRFPGCPALSALSPGTIIRGCCCCCRRQSACVRSKL